MVSVVLSSSAGWVSERKEVVSSFPQERHPAMWIIRHDPFHRTLINHDHGRQLSFWFEYTISLVPDALLGNSLFSSPSQILHVRTTCFTFSAGFWHWRACSSSWLVISIIRLIFSSLGFSALVYSSTITRKSSGISRGERSRKTFASLV